MKREEARVRFRQLGLFTSTLKVAHECREIHAPRLFSCRGTACRAPTTDSQFKRFSYVEPWFRQTVTETSSLFCRGSSSGPIIRPTYGPRKWHKTRFLRDRRSTRRRRDGRGVSSARH